MNVTWPGSVMGLMGLTNPDKYIYVSNFLPFLRNQSWLLSLLPLIFFTYICLYYSLIYKYSPTCKHTWPHPAQSLPFPGSITLITVSHYKVCTSCYHDTIYLWTHMTTTPPIPHYSTALINTDDLYLFRSRFPWVIPSSPLRLHFFFEHCTHYPLLTSRI